MRIRQSPSGPFSGRSIDKIGVIYLVNPFVTASLVLVEIPDLAFQVTMKPGDKVFPFGATFNVTSDAAATTVVRMDIVKPDGGAAPFTTPAGLVVLSNVFAAPGSVEQYAGPLEYVADSSGIHRVRVQVATTAGNLTIAAGANYIGISV